MPHPDRFKALVHYVCWSCKDPARLGATKLNKILWFVDSLSYAQHGKSISGETGYIKRQHGPVPKRILAALRELTADGSLEVKESNFFGKTKRDFITLKNPNVAEFTEQERSFIDEITSTICNDHTATSISELSHNLIWNAAELGEEIPLYAVLAAEVDEVTASDREWANELIRQKGLYAGEAA